MSFAIQRWTRPKNAIPASDSRRSIVDRLRRSLVDSRLGLGCRRPRTERGVDQSREKALSAALRLPGNGAPFGTRQDRPMICRTLEQRLRRNVGPLMNREKVH
jgi:hypothetical protein